MDEKLVLLHAYKPFPVSAVSGKLACLDEAGRSWVEVVEVGCVFVFLCAHAKTGRNEAMRYCQLVTAGD